MTILINCSRDNKVYNNFSTKTKKIGRIYHGKLSCNWKRTSCKIMLPLDKLIKTGLSSSAATLKL